MVFGDENQILTCTPFAGFAGESSQVEASLEFSERTQNMLDMFSNTDLLALLCGQSSAKVLMDRYGTLNELAKATVDELTIVKGVGECKAQSIKAAFMLASRMSRELHSNAPLLDSPDKLADLLREESRLYVVEQFQLVLLNTRRRLIRVETIAVGTLDSVLIDARSVFNAALMARASAVVLIHNHPSGDASPSEADIKVTRDLFRIGKLLKIPVLDHIILGQSTVEEPQGYVSLRELGYLYD